MRYPKEKFLFSKISTWGNRTFFANGTWTTETENGGGDSGCGNHGNKYSYHQIDNPSIFSI